MRKILGVYLKKKKNLFQKDKIELNLGADQSGLQQVFACIF